MNDPLVKDPIVGIDLGTTNSEVAALVDGEVQVPTTPARPFSPRTPDWHRTAN